MDVYNQLYYIPPAAMPQGIIMLVPPPPSAQVIKQLRLLPLQDGETVDQKVAAFRGYDDEVRRCLPDILLATMSILYTQYKQIRSSFYNYCVYLHVCELVI